MCRMSAGHGGFENRSVGSSASGQGQNGYELRIMSDVVVIRFEKQGVEGIVPLGVTLADAGRSFGIRFDSCNKGHQCAVIVTAGIDNISPMSDLETEHFEVHGRSSNERLACEARIIKPGEIVVMTKENTQEPKKAAAAASGDIHAEFNSLPLDKKFASLLQMEATTINEAVKYVADSSMKALEKLGDVISDFGAKVETEAKNATSANAKTDEPAPAEEKSKPGTKQKPKAPKE